MDNTPNPQVHTNALWTPSDNDMSTQSHELYVAGVPLWGGGRWEGLCMGESWVHWELYLVLLHI